MYKRHMFVREELQDIPKPIVDVLLQLRALLIQLHSTRIR
jgi:hypothetical protein